MAVPASSSSRCGIVAAVVVFEAAVALAVVVAAVATVVTKHRHASKILPFSLVHYIATYPDLS